VGGAGSVYLGRRAIAIPKERFHRRDAEMLRVSAVNVVAVRRESVFPSSKEG